MQPAIRSACGPRLRELIGSARVIEEGEHIIAEIDGGRLLTLAAPAGCNLGAQERNLKTTSTY